MNAPARLAIVGAGGRMGSLVGELVGRHYADTLTVAAAIRSSGDIAELGAADIVIDFSLPGGTERMVDWLERTHEGPSTVVSGTTGLPDRLLARLLALGDRRKVLYAANFCAGVAALASILDVAAPMFADLGYEPVITETHHRHKKDAPSGTALTLRDRLGPGTSARVQTHSIRAGEIVGRHEVTFYGEHDTLTLAHDALDRGAFARGAIEAAVWLSRQDVAGCSHDMQSYFAARFLRTG